MNTTNVPSDWASTGDTLPVSKWLADDRLPIDAAPAEMILYIKSKFSDDFGHILLKENTLPQDFVHWWCHMAKYDPEDKPVSIYPTLSWWIPIIGKWLGRNASASDVFGTFRAWLDILFLDQTVYQNEHVRLNVPRKYKRTIHWIKQPGNKIPESRLSTMNYIIEQGLGIFEERGWTEGYNYWKEETKKYELFS